MAILSTLKFITSHPLNRQHKAGALFRFLRWQIGSRLVSGQMVYDWVNGSRIIDSPGETGLIGNIYCGLHEFTDMAFLLHAVSEEDLFIDVGANVGSYTILACAVKGAKGFAFEPVPSTYQRLLDNVRLNGLLDNVKTLNMGLADKKDELTFTVGENCMNHVVLDGKQSPDNVSVKVVSLDEALKDESPSLLKIDAEGFESPAIDGAHATLCKPTLNSIIMELNGSGTRYGFSEDAIIETLTSHGFSAYSYEPFTRELKLLDGKNRSEGNTLFIRDIDAIKEKVRRAPKITIGNVQF